MAAVELLEIRPAGTSLPFSAQIAGDWRAAAAAWEQTGCPYEQALALMDGSDSLARLEVRSRVGAVRVAVRFHMPHLKPLERGTADCAPRGNVGRWDLYSKVC